jgi:hypothetical protein
LRMMIAHRSSILAVRDPLSSRIVAACHHGIP